MRFWLLGMIAFALACGGEEEATPEPTGEGEQAEAEGEQAEAEGHGEGPAAANAETERLSDARVMFVGIEDGATVTGPLVDGKVSVHVGMGVEGAEVRPAGAITAGTGHHHIIVDGEGLPHGTPVPADDTHIHFGGGQTEADLQLTPGEHTLLLQFADGAHRSYGPDLTARIAITVAEGEAPAEGEAAEGEGAGAEGAAE
ncbi:MAG: DUF4399 domain-containing protein [Myxococcota bacterium]